MTRPYFAIGNSQEAEREYKLFKKCLPQLIDSDEITGDLEGKWVIFKDGWVYGLAAYESAPGALQFARQMFRDEPRASYIVAIVDLESHGVSALHLLGDALSQLDFEGDDEISASDAPV